MERDVRRKTLREHYKFECECRACLEDWPLNTKLDTSVVQLKCADCCNAVTVAVDMKAYLIKCSRCGGSINFIKSFEVMKNAERMYEMATNLYDSGKTKEALTLYVQVMHQLEERFVPPTWVYNACQQRIRRYFLELR
jgi:SET and MYND domain-containing protein 4